MSKKNKASKNPLHNAVQQNNLEQVKLAIQNGGRVNLKNSHGKTALHIAVKEKCSAEIIQYLLEQSANLEIVEKNGQTPLHFAIQYNEQVTELLLKNGANPNIQDNLLQTPLFLAIERINIPYIQLLLEYGSDPNLKGINGSTALHWAAIKILSLYTLTKVVRSNININFSDLTQVFQLLIDHGADINAADFNGFTTLHLTASFECREEHLKILLDQGTDINNRDVLGSTPLLEAAVHGEKSNVEVLLNYGADVHCSAGQIDKILENSLNSIKVSQCLQVLLEHSIKLKMVNLLDEKVYALWKSKIIKHSPDLEKFEKDCTAELEKMRAEMICTNLGISFADLLLKPLRKVAHYLQTCGVKEQLDENDLDTLFPIYSKVLKLRIRKSTNLANLLNDGFESLQRVLQMRLPHSILTNIFGFLCVEDVIVLNRIN